MKNLIFYFFLLLAITSKSQTVKDYSCNSHVKYSVDSVYGKFKISYTFKDDKDIMRNFCIYYNYKKTIKDIARFGIPKSFYENTSLTQQVSKSREKIIKKGFYKQTGNILKPDRSAIVSFYRPYCRAIAGGIINILLNENRDNRLSRIEMAMKFVQDIPYGIPEIKDSTWEVYGIYTPPEVLTRMYGDCDSKAILFATILSYLIDIKDVLFLYQGRDHALLAIKGIPNATQKYIEVDKVKYLIADVTGPARLSLGDDGNNFDALLGYKVEPIKIKGYRFHNI
ncbi:MAG: hypothetical protein HGB12_09960 [Bacteroidetes bacterium]|nr:hypothetical protein [Bacteroidota bacterium]